MIIEFLQNLDPTIQGALIGSAGTLLTALLAFFGIAWQLKAQRTQSNEAIAENERRKLKATMYEDAVSVARELIDASISLSTSVRSTVLQVRHVATLAGNGQQFVAPRTRIQDILSKSDEVQKAAVRFIFLIEERRFIDPRLLVFRSAMNSAAHDVRLPMTTELFVKLVDSVQHELPNGEYAPYKVPTVEEAELLREESEKLFAALRDIECYAEDFLVEMQNLLLGDLFGNSVDHREPIDPNSKVISVANYKQLEDWFNNSTPWGRECNRVEAETRERLAPKS